MTLTVGSLFSGIGGIDLGLERAGMRVRWQVEIDAWCRAVLAKHWPDVERFEDVRSVGAGSLRAVDVVAGGFPCQDISYAGKGEGISGSRSGLWSEFARIIGDLRPGYVLVENVPALKVRGLEVVLADLAALGYDAEWDCIPAAAAGAPHLRDRIWLIAYRQENAPRPYADSERSHRAPLDFTGSLELRDEQERQLGSLGAALADAYSERSPERRQRALAASEGSRRGVDRGGSGDVAGQERVRGTGQGAGDVAHANGEGQLQPPRAFGQERGRPSDSGWWAVEPDVGRVAYGVPNRVDRLRGLGNAVVPQVVEWIGRRIVEAEAVRT